MSFFARKRQKTAVAKKSWEIEDSDDDSEADDNGEAKIPDPDNEEAPQEMICKECKGERDADAFCKDCSLYFCIDCFTKTHALPESSASEEKDSRKGKPLHKIRGLVGGKNLSVLEVGWIEGNEKSQVTLKEEREKAKAEKEAALKAAREAAEKERKEKEAAAAAAKQALAAAAAARIVESIKATAAAPIVPQPVATPQAPQTSKRHVFVSNIPFEAKLSDVRKLFANCGRIVDASMPQNRKRMLPQNMMQQPTHRGIAFMEFDSEEGAANAIQLDGQILCGRPVRVAMDILGHTRNQPHRPTGVPYKRKMCIYFQQGKCVRGELCSFAHHPREIIENQNTYIPKPQTQPMF